MGIAPSYVHGTGSEPLEPLTVGQCLDRAAGRGPDGDALIVAYQDVRWSYRKLREVVDAYAAGLVALGLKPGERIGIWAPNCWEWVVTQFATAKAGLILVNINPAYRLPELAYALDKVGCAALITAPTLKTSDYIAMLGELIPELAASQAGKLASQRFRELRLLIRLGEEKSPGFLNFGDISAAAGPDDAKALARLQGQLQFDDPINIQFTSGTTGAPKAATLTHHNIVNNAFSVGRQMRLTARDRM